MNALLRVFRRNSFFPGFLGLFSNPFYFARKGLVQAVRPLAGQVRGRTLDVGCGQKPYQELFAWSEYVGLELDTPENRALKRADIFYDGRQFPFPAESFDSVVCNQVLEHVFTPAHFLAEIHRVLKGGGVLLLTVPFLWDEHEQPFDFARYSSFGIRFLLEEHGFEIVAAAKTMPDARVIFQMINAYLFKLTVTRNRYLDLLATAVLMSPFNILGELLGRLLPANQDLYLDNVVLARKSNPS